MLKFSSFLGVYILSNFYTFEIKYKALKLFIAMKTQHSQINTY